MGEGLGEGEGELGEGEGTGEGEGEGGSQGTPQFHPDGAESQHAGLEKQLKLFPPSPTWAVVGWW